jgi:Mrp family chromosome partitioning ATPase
MPELHGEYDLVLYDLSHFMDGTDVYNISAETDGIIFVVAKKRTAKSRAIQAAKKAKDLRLPVLGVITNFS